MAERERAALIVAPFAGLLWGMFMAFLAFRFDGGEVVLLQGFILGGAWLCGWLSGRPATGAAAGLLFVGTAIWTYEILPGWGFEHSLPRLLPIGDREDVIRGFDAADIVLATTHLVGTLCGLGGGLWASAPDPEDAIPEPEQSTPAPRPLPPLLERPVEPLWSDATPAAATAPRPEAVQRPVSPPPGADSGRGPGPEVPRRRIAGAALAVAALGTDAALGVLFFSYSDPQETGAWLFAALAAIAAALLGRRYALAALAAGIILAAGFGAIQDAEYGDRSADDITVIR
jgi:hypothetical protein